VRHLDETGLAATEVAGLLALAKASLYLRLGSIPLKQVRPIISRLETFFNDWINVIASDAIPIAVAIYSMRCHKFFFWL
jgi:hypothetical protein